MSIFQQSVVNKYSNGLDKNRVKAEYEKFKKIFCDAGKSDSIQHLKEEQYQEGFLRDLFKECLWFD
ncbi:MAG: hypothetical protein A2015_04730 [Spirochaetes bacterium GWF1_31_7]|nr:MAG: hypothetical protein A2Y30_05110 [Spirochaetes bacterium GWE1_32_154]OHD48774.1 MAG: hypothetical protein A2Y29_03085 [Spirochaetes bacterium GWE2_31_10]OHD52837.1 MAG: hypothetical protein A2015_04730 [Spirochaetes bacterium GWF1_31_7]OHD81488.1 MAG: hypothetical protein A2355_00775 [Spirochaetes bacterium RIFOXYB1_FULL_32_8]HBD95185.1 hypothetical protein [Spirochaetia bacterium]